MIVVVILGICRYYCAKIMGRPDEARATRALQDIRAITAALDLYRLDNYSYPTQTKDWKHCDQAGRFAARYALETGRLLDQMPQMPG